MLSSSVEAAMSAFLKKKEEYDALAETGPFGYMEHYATLRQKALKYRDQEEYSCSDGEKPYNTTKNRYKDIIPYNYNRVKLAMLNEMPGTDYINASYVKGPANARQYIAAQGPLPNTVKDFWRMLWEQKASVVLMACAEYEGIPPKHRCERYWPNSADESLTFDQISVSLEKEIRTEFADYVIRELRVEHCRQVHKVHQLHYVGWPDHGVPNDVSPILDLIAKCHQYQTDQSVPLVVHCSAGCGRTGTLIAIDYAYSMLKLGKLGKEFSLFDVIDDMRKQRPSMVQSVDQYRFAYSAVAELFLRHISTMTKHPYENVKLKPSKSQNPPVKNSAAPSVQTGSPENSLDETMRKQKPLLPGQKQLITCGKAKPEISIKPELPANKPKPDVRNSCEISISVKDRINKLNQSKPPLKPKPDGQLQQNLHSPVEKVCKTDTEKSTIDSLTNASSEDQSKCVTIVDVDTDGYVITNLDNSESEDCEMDPHNERSSERKDSSNEEASDGLENPYSYANPLACNKWSLQHYAIKSEVNTEGAYAEVDALVFSGYANADEDYSEDEDAPELPPKLFTQEPECASAKTSKLSKMSSKDITVRSQISFPNRPSKPKGPREPVNFQRNRMDSL